MVNLHTHGWADRHPACEKPHGEVYRGRENLPKGGGTPQIRGLCFPLNQEKYFLRPHTGEAREKARPIGFASQLAKWKD